METNKDPADRTTVHAAAEIKDPPGKISRQMSRTTSLPDASIPVKKLIYALLAISLGTVIECESDLSYHCLCSNCTQLCCRPEPRRLVMVPELVQIAAAAACWRA
jgi:hypothetical protein